jgi:hypothetical protein
MLIAALDCLPTYMQQQQQQQQESSTTAARTATMQDQHT